MNRAVMGRRSCVEIFEMISMESRVGQAFPSHHRARHSNVPPVDDLWNL